MILIGDIGGKSKNKRRRRGKKIDAEDILR
jgi:hypothetical protein